MTHIQDTLAALKAKFGEPAAGGALEAVAEFRGETSVVVARSALLDVLAFLKANNLHRLNLDKIAFRMADAKFFQQTVELLAWIAKWRLVLAAHVRAKLQLSAAVVYRRLRGMVGLGVLSYTRIFHAQPGIYQVTNGGAQMPAFKDRLSKTQIEAVAAYVSSVAGK